MYRVSGFRAAFRTGNLYVGRSAIIPPLFLAQRKRMYRVSGFRDVFRTGNLYVGKSTAIPPLFLVQRKNVA
jgi:hypothetical protein